MSGLDLVLVPLAALTPHRAELARRAADVGLVPGVLEGEASVALLYALLFERWPELLGELAADVRVYNHYFWFTRFMALRGREVGLEQQQHQILERAAVALDWQLVERLEAVASAAQSQESS